MTKITTDFVGTENIAVTKQRLTDILAYWGASTAAYTTWGQARTALNALLTSTTAGTIGSTELAGTFLPKINFLNDPDDMIADALFGAGEQGVWLDPSDVANVDWRRNMLLQTEAFDTVSWGKNGAGVVANAATAPDATSTADLIYPLSTGGYRQVFQLPASGCNTLTVYAKAAGLSHLFFMRADGNLIGAWFNLSTGVKGTVIAGYTHDMVSVGNGWYRCTLRVDTGTFSFTQIGVSDADNSPTATASGTNGIYLWGAQAELGATATDYQRITDLNTEVIERFPNATMFQDAAGTVPVYAPGQPVGLRLDKSKGLVLGSELVTNGAFATNVTNWTATASGILSWDPSGAAKVVRNGSNDFGILQTVSGLQAGATYRLSGSVTGDVTGIYYKINRVPSGFTAGKLTNTILFVAPATSITLEVIAYGGYTDGQFGLFDNVSVKLLPGNHATQSTAGSRPMYGIEPKGGRRNLLLATDTLATQSVTVANALHILSFWGTGTVTLSGASTAGPLVGTGAGNRVYLEFTPTAGSLTLTVSGSVTSAQLERG